MHLYHIYTDGACSGNPGPGGWAAVILDGTEKVILELSGFEPNTTNNRMEVMAAIKGIEQVQKLAVKPDIKLYSDSNYLVQAYTKGWMKSWLATNWKKGTVKNQDLWQELNALLSNTSVQWIKVKGHADNNYNNRCDHLAVQQIKLNAAGAPIFEEQGSLPKAQIQREVSRSNTPSPCDGHDLLNPTGSNFIDPSTLNNPLSKKPSENRCLVALADFPLNLARIQQVADRFSYADMKKAIPAQAMPSITSSIATATFNHPHHKVHPYFLHPGDMADFWLTSNAERTKPYPAPSRVNLVKFICSFVVEAGAVKAKELNLWVPET